MNDERPFGINTRPGVRSHPGKSSFYRGAGALAVAAVGYLVGFLLPYLISPGAAGSPAANRMVFAPVGGIVSLWLAVMAIYIGGRVLRFAAGLTDERRERLAGVMDLEGERRWAVAGIALGVVSIAVNPLLAYIVIMIVRA